MAEKRTMEENLLAGLLRLDSLPPGFTPSSVSGWLSGSEDLRAAAFPFLAAGAISRALTVVEGLQECCESPIEEAFGLALYAVAQRECYVNFDGPINSPIEPLLDRIITIVPQCLIGSYRVDFSVSLGVRTNYKGSAFHTTTADFKQYSVVVECDGHDFHDRTKEQASRDRKRDRALQTLGFQVFRFTGSDIWKDPVACAIEVVDGLKSAAKNDKG